MSEIALTLAVRGVMVSNENPAPGWIPVKGQKKFNDRYTQYISNDAIQKMIFNFLFHSAKQLITISWPNVVYLHTVFRRTFGHQIIGLSLTLLRNELCELLYREEEQFEFLKQFVKCAYNFIAD